MCLLPKLCGFVDKGMDKHEVVTEACRLEIHVHVVCMMQIIEGDEPSLCGVHDINVTQSEFSPFLDPLYSDGLELQAKWDHDIKNSDNYMCIDVGD